MFDATQEDARNTSRKNRRRRDAARLAATARANRRLSHETLERRHLLAAITGAVWGDANVDGLRQAEEVGAADVRVYLDANDNSVLDAGETVVQSDVDGAFQFDGLGAGDYVVRIDNAVGQTQTAPGTHVGVGELTDDTGTEVRYFSTTSDGNVTLLGSDLGRSVDGLVQTNAGLIVGIDSSTGDVLTLDATTFLPTVVATVSEQLGGGLAYDPVHDVVYATAKDAASSSRYRLQELDVATGALTPLGTGTTSLSDVTGMAFDSNSRTVIAHDSTTNTAIEFLLDGLALPKDLTSLDNASGALAMAGPLVVLADPPGREGGNFFTINPVDDSVVRSNELTSSLTVTALDDSVTLNAGIRVSLVDNAGVVDDVSSLEFGVQGVATEIVLLASGGSTTVSVPARDDTFELRLSSQPATDVSLLIDSSSNAILVSDTTLTFTPENWDQPQTLTLSLLGVTTEGSTQITVSVDTASSDPSWSAAVDQVLPVTIEGTEGSLLRAGYISEILVNPLFGNNDTDQYVELRGRPNTRLPDGTYFVIVDEDNFQTGEIHGIFDLSGQFFGDTGYLVLLQEGSPHVPVFGANVLQSTATGFGGLPGDIYTDSHTLSDRIDFINTNNGYFLIQTDVAPVLDADIDADNDGLVDPDGVASDWLVLDSVSLHNNSSSDQAYGQIALVNDPLTLTRTITTAPNVAVVRGPGRGYVARVGASLGHDAEDWILGTAGSDGPESPEVFELSDRIFGPARPHAFYGRDLDHVGDDNFVGGVQGSLAFLPPLQESQDGATPELVSIPVLADTNGNGVRDVLGFSVEPDDAIGRVQPLGPLDEVFLTNAYPGVTIRTFSLGSVSTGNVTARQQREFPDTLENHHFTQGGIDWFTPSSRLRFDFYRPASSVSILAMADDFPFSPVYGRLEAYDKDDNLLGFVRSRALYQGTTEQLSLSFGGDVIAYAMAFSDSDFLNSSPFGRFDSFAYTQPEASTLTDGSGVYSLHSLVPGDYDIRIQDRGFGEAFYGGAPKQITISDDENFQFFEAVRINSRPVVDDVVLGVDENPLAGFPLGQIAASDLDGHSLTFDWLSQETYGLSLDPTSGEIWAGASNGVDFEARSEIVLSARVTDELGGTSDVSVTLNVADVNEAPQVSASELSVSEAAPLNQAIGRIIAIDPDAEQAQQLSYEIVGGTAAAALSIHPTTGLVNVADPSRVDFETNPTMSLTVRVTDSGSPSLATTQQVLVRVDDANDSPILLSSNFDVPENTSGAIGTLVFSDSDASQSLTARLVGGTGQGVFTVDSDGTVSVSESATLDFETKDSYTLEVVVSDDGAPPLATSGIISVQLLDVDEAPSLTISEVTVAEDATLGTAIAVLGLDDSAGDPSRFELLLADASIVYQFDASTGLLSVNDGANFDFETAPTDSIPFLVRDATGVLADLPVNVQVTVTDANDAPEIRSTGFGLSELTSPGTTVATVRASDADGDALTFAITGGSGASQFEIDPATGVIRVVAGASFDADQSVSEVLTLDVQVTDANALSVTKTLAVTINDVNEAPIFVGSLPMLTIASGATLDYQLPADVAIDPEGRDFLLTIGDANGRLPSWLSYDSETRTLSGTPNPFSRLTESLFATAFEPAGQAKLSSRVELQLQLEGSEKPLRNERSPFDVDANGRVAALDALRIINFINRNGSGVRYDGDYDFSQLSAFSGFVDVNGDEFVTAQDALLVINAILRGDAATIVVVPEGEQPTSVAPLSRTQAVDRVFADDEETGLLF